MCITKNAFYLKFGPALGCPIYCRICSLAIKSIDEKNVAMWFLILTAYVHALLRRHIRDNIMHSHSLYIGERAKVWATKFNPITWCWVGFNCCYLADLLLDPFPSNTQSVLLFTLRSCMSSSGFHLAFLKRGLTVLIQRWQI